MKYAFIFPGQASQFVGMARDLYEQFDLAREYFDKANDILGLDLKKLCFEGPEEELKQTYITQPAIFVHSTIVAGLLKQKGIEPQAVAGHSLGEYSALVAAGAFDFESGFRLVKERSRLMFQAGQSRPGTMGAIIGLEDDQVKEICASLKSEGIVQPANFNSPGQVAISGERDVVLKALEVSREKGARKAVELEVSGAFHSPLMEEAIEGLQKAIASTDIKDIDIPVYTNVTAGPVKKSAEVGELLLKQLSSPVRWREIIENMAKDGFENFAEVGPGKVLKGLHKRINRDLDCQTCGTVEELNTFGS